MAVGIDVDAPGLLPDVRSDPLDAIGSVVREALSRPPCVVSFSGGRDSSVVLALATREARAHGLADPIPMSLRFPDVPQAEESAWQERLVAGFGLSEWERVDMHDELDFLGTIARDGLERHGLLWPPNAHFHVPVFRRAAGGTVMTGFDGDGLFTGWRWERAQSALHRRVRPELRDALRIGLASAPASIRRLVMRPRTTTWATWLRPDAQRRLGRVLADQEASQPRRWDWWLDTYLRDRFVRLPTHSLAVLADAHDVRVVHPLADPRFISALARTGGAVGFGDRTSATRTLFGGLLPDEVLQRRTKAEFGYALWGPEALAFAREWDGAGVDAELVDPDLLRHAWLEPNPSLAAATLLQDAWLSSRRTDAGASHTPPGSTTPREDAEAGT